MTTPVGAALSRLGVTADQLTVLGLLTSAAAGLAVGSGMRWWGALLVAASGLPDLLDGAVARASAKSSPRGQFFDSVADRVSDGLVFGGVTWYVGVSAGAVAAIPAAVMVLSMLISYERAKGEALGFTASNGLMERGERFVFLIAALLVPDGLVALLTLMLVLTAVTVVQRFQAVWRQASGAGRDEVPGGADVPRRGEVNGKEEAGSREPAAAAWAWRSGRHGQRPWLHRPSDGAAGWRPWRESAARSEGQLWLTTRTARAAQALGRPGTGGRARPGGGVRSVPAARRSLGRRASSGSGWRDGSEKN
ncbi:MAG: CDP-alcohol phosphatidyltransferase family protein [Actinomycetota bacterium]|nr:CDP-alcohol phosphatidyltransferase family protein [Actinomycetota bacterium]